MGTSSSGGGAGGGNPLIPSWIDNGGLPPPQSSPPDMDQTDQSSPEDNSGDAEPGDNNGGPAPNGDGETSINPPLGGAETRSNNRYTLPKKQFNKYSRSGGRDTTSLRQALKSYSRTAAGSTSALARRMRPSASRVAIFYETIDTIRRRGATTALTEFNLAEYVNQPLLDTLSALGDLVFSDTGKVYEDTQDDSITKVAYANTVIRICEDAPDMDLNDLSNDQVEVMMAIFIEETIAQRVINDIGNQYTETLVDIEALLEIENGIYQIVKGMVRNQIMPEISATRRGDKQDLERNIENIYRTAFDAMAGTND
ncbi:Qat anti-phage system associated protein QatB [Segetibacter koreensis]|uniref:Qat anti-phage system associated protein QatB n=1 Tax=Segetibacter koreensis TaxID=398037 RepID=UPI0003691C15|nr:Qat anti-phage system associated protein QatB [Segetibacter koreensis]